MVRGADVDEFEIGRAAGAPPAVSVAGRMRPARSDRARLALRAGPAGWVALAVALVAVGVVAVPPAPAPVAAWGLVGDLTRPPVEAWSVEVSARQASVQLTAGHVVVATPGAVLGFDATDGSPAWEVVGASLRCALVSTPVVCVSGSGNIAEVLRIDPEDGLLARLAVPDAMLATQHGGDLIVLRQEAEGQVLTRVAGDDSFADARWRSVVNGTRTTVVGWGVIAVVGDEVVVESSPGAVVDLASGVLVRERVEVHEVADGVLVRDPGADVQLMYARGGGPPVELPAEASMLLVDDDPTGPTFTTLRPRPPARPSLGAFTRDSDDPEWTFPRLAYPVARLDGRLVAWGQTGVTALDATTGERLWPDESQLNIHCPCWGSGAVLLALQWNWRGHLEMVALDTHDGRVRWAAPVHGDVTQDTATDGRRLAVLTDTALTLWNLTITEDA